ncbi:hypothetical protein B0H63DRAFT_313241 [Podospora didyma]|uniref:Uncharacterized protein n=1 Tax=Podospora didyma TaxID=330526 RepID=A0AAE0K5H3_9PEZI|nr:hypothetical protein B0H63DRAFT_313241 [Podospora didyma]
MMRSYSWGFPTLLEILGFIVPQIVALPQPDIASSTFSFIGNEYEDAVCKPMVLRSTETVPPCLEIETIERICSPNGTTPLALEAHRQCMCGGSFFVEWPFCLQCLYTHGLRSERDVFHHRSVISAASSTLCNAAVVTATFAAIFKSVSNTLPTPTTGATISSDRAVSKTAVSLYFTATQSQGPGRITGSAAAATATALFTAPPLSNDSGGVSSDGLGQTVSTKTGLASVTKPGSIASSSTASSDGDIMITSNVGLLAAGVLVALVLL